MKEPRFQDIRDQYTADWLEVECTPDRRGDIDAIVDFAYANRRRYSVFGEVPWPLVAALHNMECSQRFDRHLHNGDPISHKTVNVPKDRPPGNGPWPWEVSARDALKIDGLLYWADWSVAGCLYKAEAYNGWGYRGHGIRSPYLWGGSNKQETGKYIRDGVWSSTAITKQIGVATILCRMFERDIYVFPEDREDV